MIYGEPGFSPLWETWLQTHPEATGNRFHYGYADNERRGMYGWMIQRNCDPSSNASIPCMYDAETDLGVRPSNDTVYVAPAFGKLEPPDPPHYPAGFHAYAARDIEWYKAGWDALTTWAVENCPLQVIVGGVNDCESKAYRSRFPRRPIP